MDFFSTAISQTPISAIYFIIAIFGLVFGSFATLLSHRLTTKEAVVFARSQCPKCHYQLKFYNLIPVFSWLFQGGKCSNCKQKISLRYPLIEVSVATIFLLSFYFSGQQLDQHFLLICLIAFTLILMSIVDLEHYFIPNITQYFLAICVILLRINDAGPYGAAMNLKAAFTYLGFGLLMLWFFYVTTKIEAIGVDDLKFFFIAGIALGMNNFLLFMLISSVLGAFFGVIWQKLKDDYTFPFGPPICLALYIILLSNNSLNPVEIFESLVF